MLHDFFQWIQDTLGRDICETDPASPLTSSWAGNLHESQTLWSITEGAHVLTLCLFAGTIFLVDLRMLGVAFRNTPYSKLHDKVLPLTIIGFALMILTGVILFLSKPAYYYHSIWFRFKMVFILIAAINIFWFHFVAQRDQEKWDAAEKPPFKVRLSAIISLSCWAIVICFGRFIPYNWFESGRVLSMVQDSVIAHAQSKNEISDRELAMAQCKGIIPTIPKPHAWTAGDSAATFFFQSVYALSEHDRERGPAPTIQSIKEAIHGPVLTKMPIEIEGIHAQEEVEKQCMIPEDRDAARLAREEADKQAIQSAIDLHVACDQEWLAKNPNDQPWPLPPGMTATPPPAEEPPAEEPAAAETPAGGN